MPADADDGNKTIGGHEIVAAAAKVTLTMQMMPSSGAAIMCQRTRSSKLASENNLAN